MAGLEGPNEQTAAMRRGLVFEPVIRDLFRAEHPEVRVFECGGFARADEPRFTATPDGLILVGCRTDGLLEIKHVFSVLPWDREGVPDYYQAQAQWQMFVTGHDHVVFAVSDAVRLGKLEHREFVVERDGDFIVQLVMRALEFLAELDGRKGETA